MNAYNFFAGVYESFMTNIPYADWIDRISGYLHDKKIEPGASILEVGCGTGSFSRLLAIDGYNVYGIDLSPQMIRQAKKKKNGLCVEYHVADMRDFKLNESFDAVISVCDSMNYLCTINDLNKTFLNVSKAIKKGGIFLFDMKTQVFYKKLGDGVFTDEIKNCKYIWENNYDENTGNNFYSIDFFKKNFLGYRRYTEEHVQHAFSIQEVIDAAQNNGFLTVDILDEDMNKLSNQECDRIYYVFRMGE